MKPKKISLAALFFIFAAFCSLFFTQNRALALGESGDSDKSQWGMSDESDKSETAITENYSGMADEPWNLDRIITHAVSESLDLKAGERLIKAGEMGVKKARADFFPELAANYSATRNYEKTESPYFGVLSPENQFALSIDATQPLFTGFALTNQYKLAGLGLSAAELSHARTRLQLIFSARNAYYTVLKALRQEQVAEDAVTTLEAQLKQASEFYEVGLIPLNDRLRTEVELANARQDLVRAKNGVALAKAQLNTLLRKPVTDPIRVDENYNAMAFEQGLEKLFAEAEKKRIEIKQARVKVAATETEADLAAKDRYPAVSLEGTWWQMGTRADFTGNEGISDPNGWQVALLATWKIFDSGRTDYAFRQKLQEAEAARQEEKLVFDMIRLEVQQAYLKALEARENIEAVKKAVTQAEESLRITRERYEQQVATTTDVLDAQTLLSKTRTNYYNALFDFEIAKASLFLAVGRDLSS